MGFVKTKEEIERIQASLHKPRFVNCEMLTVNFLSTPAFVASVLPPGLEPSELPRMTALVGRWQSNCVGDFDGGAIYIEARHKDIVGDYVLSMYMDRDQPIIYGRELFGEPKKQCSTRLFRRGQRLNGCVDRYGTHLIDLDVELSTDHGPGEAVGVNFNYKAFPAANGLGLEWDAALTVATFQTIMRVNSEGSGAVTLKGSVHDPLEDIEIVEVLSGGYIEGDLIAKCETVAHIDAEAFLPYALGRNDDWSALNTAERTAVVAGVGPPTAAARISHGHAG